MKLSREWIKSLLEVLFPNLNNGHNGSTILLSTMEKRHNDATHLYFEFNFFLIRRNAYKKRCWKTGKTVRVLAHSQKHSQWRKWRKRVCNYFSSSGSYLKNITLFEMYIYPLQPTHRFFLHSLHSFFYMKNRFMQTVNRLQTGWEVSRIYTKHTYTQPLYICIEYITQITQSQSTKATFFHSIEYEIIKV